jgi:CRP-like cAMP-binding protein
MANRFVEKLSGFAKLPAGDVAALQALTGKARRVAGKVDLIREGDEPGPVFVILDGWACRYKILPKGTRQITAFMLPGDCCDLHIAMLKQMDHGIQTVTACSVATISRSEMTALLDERPNIARALYIAQLIDESTLRSWIVSMGRRSSVERLAHLMCELYLRASAVEGVGGATIDLPLSQVQLADAMGMTPVHINRVLKELREAGAMEIRRGHLSITDPVKLVHIAGFDENYLHRRLQQGTAYR